MAFWFALMVWAVTLATVILFMVGDFGLPVAISELAREIDAQFLLTLVITGVAFVLAEGLLGLFVIKYRDRPSGAVRYLHGNNSIEIGSAIVVGVVFIALAILGVRLWGMVHLSGAVAGAMPVEITGEQFAWNVRYSGPDGQFGRTSPELYDATANPVGIVADDPAGRDDIVALNTLTVPAGRPVELRLRSKDVLHSFFMPVLRLKQDTVPGMEIPLLFLAEKTGTYEVACAELCGLGHYRMRGMLQVMEPSAFEAWLAEQAAQAAP